VKTGNPNGEGLPFWPQMDTKDGYQVMHLNGWDVHASADPTRAQQEFLDTHSRPARPASASGTQ
jgi:carboxylesterase type B